MKERFFELVRMLSKNPTEFAKSIEISGAVLSSIKSGRTDLSMMVVTRTKEKYKNVNLEWLFTGEGSPFLDGQQSDGNDDTSNTKESSDNNTEKPNDYNFGNQELPIDENGTSVVAERAATYISSEHTPVNDSTANDSVLKEPEPVVYKPVMMVSQPEQVTEQVKKKISQIVIMYNDETYETLNKN